MATQPTQLPVPSESPRDLKFNAGKIDEFVTSLERQYIDRFGSNHYTIEGLRWLAQYAISQFGYITLDSFQAGATITLPNQVLRDTSNGEYYRWDGALPKVVAAGSTPQKSGGVGVGKWISVGDASLRAELKKATGSQLIGISPSGTLADALYFVTPEMFGAVADGVNDDRVAINLAIATGKPVMMQSYYNVSSGSINILPGTRLISKGARIKSTSTTSAMIYAVNVDDWNIEGRLSLIGLGSTTDQGQIGILESGCQNYRVDNVTASGIAGRAFYQNTVGTWEAPRGNKGAWTNCAAYYCYRGEEDVANNSSDNLMNEFTTWMNFKASGCQIGVRTSAGNCQFIGGMLVDNVEGFTSPEVGTNTTHGQCVGMTIAHNSLYNVNMVAQTAGFTFSGCSIYGDSPTVGVVRLDRCRGIKFVGGNFEASIYNDGPGTNFVIGCYNNNNFAFFRSGSNPEGIVITDLYDKNGYSSRNDVFWGHSEATLTGNALYSYMVSNYAGRIGFNFATRDPQKTLDVTNAATMGYKYCRISGRVGVSTKIHITGMTAGATAYLTLVRVRAGVANEDVCYQVIPPYTTTAVAGCLNTELNVLAGDALFIKLTLSTGDGTISASRTEFAAHYIGGAG
ncbi:hypothetical protein [Pantoea agglomerans]|jgi:hypothetical protein|uniref:tail fiber/spike domain-containing protein n=1 Tax=Enterobacter agglomerans TaxID=549 RepID=UPI00191A6EFF|nr:hypothetical protein [Pantoea agglomerans]SMQ21009.1 hypothetical protein SAMN02744765_0418 [Pantoea agglomerans]